MRFTLASLLLLSIDWFSQSVGAIQVIVINADGQPMADAKVYAYPEGNIELNTKLPSPHTYGRTDTHGKYLFVSAAPGRYTIHVFKEEEGYPDNFFGFMNYQGQGVQSVEVKAGQVSSVTLALRVKFAILKTRVEDENGKPPRGVSFSFIPKGSMKETFGTGGDISGSRDIFVPPVPFRVRVKGEGYATYESDILDPRPGEVISLHVRFDKTRSVIIRDTKLEPVGSPKVGGEKPMLKKP